METLAVSCFPISKTKIAKRKEICHYFQLFFPPSNLGMILFPSTFYVGKRVRKESVVKWVGMTISRTIIDSQENNCVPIHESDAMVDLSIPNRYDSEIWPLSHFPVWHKSWFDKKSRFNQSNSDWQVCKVTKNVAWTASSTRNAKYLGYFNFQTWHE